MLDAIASATRFIAGRTRRDLEDDEMLLFALVRAVEIVGEAATRVSEETRLRVNIPWAAVSGMRNRLVHAYFDIDRDILWATVTQALGPLQHELERALSPDA
jgi:uncharacterized protein with HEPN domain